MIIVAFGFERKVGKDTAVSFGLSFLKQFHNDLTCVRLSFGDQVKKIAHRMYDWAGLQEGIYYENHPSEKELMIPKLGKSPRDIWEELGAYGRSIFKETWIQMAFEGLDCDIALCSDMRDPFEATFLKQFKSCHLVKIEREVAPKGYTSLVEGLQSYDKWDRTITNNGTLKEYNLKIKQLFVEILNQRGIHHE